jgi:hypothetical protein
LNLREHLRARGRAQGGGDEPAEEGEQESARHGNPLQQGKPAAPRQKIFPKEHEIL